MSASPQCSVGKAKELNLTAWRAESLPDYLMKLESLANGRREA